MKTVKIRNTIIGEGMPKICLPIVGKNKEEITDQAKVIAAAGADVAEWRIDWFDDVFDSAKVTEILHALRDILGDMALLVTFRTSKEGGEKSVSPEDYAAINLAAASTGLADLIDVEIFTGDETVKKIIDGAHETGVFVIASNHDFHKTPDKDEIIRRLLFMQEMGADIAKIAVMPENAADVLTLLTATQEMVSGPARIPVITMSMGGQGVISRLCGEVFGSALTFGCAGKASAPGQMEVGALKTVLSLLHDAM